MSSYIHCHLILLLPVVISHQLPHITEDRQLGNIFAFFYHSISLSVTARNCFFISSIAHVGCFIRLRHNWSADSFMWKCMWQKNQCHGLLIIIIQSGRVKTVIEKYMMMPFPSTQNILCMNIVWEYIYRLGHLIK